jgi:hypothetical protein
LRNVAQCVREHDDEYRKRVRTMLNLVGERGTCKYCDKTVFWVVNQKTGTKSPMTEEALNHHADCPNKPGA